MGLAWSVVPPLPPQRDPARLLGALNAGTSSDLQDTERWSEQMSPAPAAFRGLQLPGSCPTFLPEWRVCVCGSISSLARSLGRAGPSIHIRSPAW